MKRHGINMDKVADTVDEPIEEPSPDEVRTGVVTYFNDQKGFGFILLPDGNSLFYHISRVDDGHISKGDRVQFNTVKQQDGRTMAIHVVKIDSGAKG